MNLVLFETSELQNGLDRSDPRVRHVETVLRRRPGEPFDAGVVDGPRGKAWVAACDGNRVTFGHRFAESGGSLYPIHLLVGISRPQTIRHVLRDGTALGVARITLFVSDNGEPSYAGSGALRDDAIRASLIDGAQQSFSTMLPSVDRCGRLEALRGPLAVQAGSPLAARSGQDALREQPVAESRDAARTSGIRIALDNYASVQSIVDVLSGSLGPPNDTVTRGEAVGVEESLPHVAVAVGSERGWSDRERGILRDSGFVPAHLGERVLRTETAATVAVGIVLAMSGRLRRGTPSTDPRRAAIE